MTRASAIRSSILIALGSSAACSGTAGPELLSYEELVAQAYYDRETNTYVVNGDELVTSEQEMRDVYAAYVASVDEVELGYGVARQGLTVNRVGGNDDAWSFAAATKLTYCVSQASFGSRYDAVVQAMADAAAAWQVTATVHFVHVGARDTSCNNSTPGVVFNVRSVSGQPFLARSFFPSTARANREVLIDASSFGSIAPFTLTGILRHELGHTLGFRHEHTRPEAGTCFEDNSWRALTAYDSASVMHYPQCNGTNTGDLALTGLDKEGAFSLYPLPLPVFDVVEQTYPGLDFGLPSPWTPITGDFDGDGRTDYARAGATGAFVYFGNGGNTFANGFQNYGNLNFGIPSQWQTITGDFNGDGRTDYARLGDTGAWISYGNADRSFSLAFQNYDGLSFGIPSPWTPITGDFNGDGKTDYARLGDTGAWVFFGQTSGFTRGFQNYDGLNFGIPSQWQAITGDFNGDGKTDYARLGDTGAWVFPGNGERGFAVSFENYNGLNFRIPSPWQPITGAFNGGARTGYARLGGTSAFLFIPR